MQGKKKEIKLAYHVPITTEIKEGLTDFIIAGTAINATTTSNNHKFLAEELKNSAGTLTGVPLLADHRNEVSAIKGRVLIGEYDENNQKINFKAKVVDADAKELIKNGLLNSVSVGASVKEIVEENDVLIPKGIVFKELSLVAVPADDNATFTTAMFEAYKTMKDDKEDDEEILDDEDEEDTEDMAKEAALMIKCPQCKKAMKKGGKCPNCEKKEEKNESDSKLLKGGSSKMEQSVEVKSVAPSVDMTEVMKAIESLKASNDALKAEISTLKQPKVEAKAETVEEDEKCGKYKIVQGAGSIRGGCFTLVR